MFNGSDKEHVPHWKRVYCIVTMLDEYSGVRAKKLMAPFLSTRIITITSMMIDHANALHFVPL